MSPITADVLSAAVPTFVTSAIVHGLWTFIRTYVLRAGFLDGREGFMLAVSNAEGAYYRYLKLMRLNERRPRPK